jgi:hypothetical protein
MTDKDDTVKYDTIPRELELADEWYSDDNIYPVYLTGQVSPPINGYSLWFTLTEATPTLKRLLFPEFFDSEMGH